MPAARSLQLPTKMYLADILVGRGAGSQLLVGPLGTLTSKIGDVGVLQSARKYGYDRASPPGGANAGRYRIVKAMIRLNLRGNIHNQTYAAYFKGVHVGHNSYIFHPITFPACGNCGGTHEVVNYGGTVRNEGLYIHSALVSGPCPNCRPNSIFLNMSRPPRVATVALNPVAW